MIVVSKIGGSIGTDLVDAVVVLSSMYILESISKDPRLSLRLGALVLRIEVSSAQALESLFAD